MKDRFDDFDELLFNMSPSSRKTYTPPKRNSHSTDGVELTLEENDEKLPEKKPVTERKIRTARYTAPEAAEKPSSAPFAPHGVEREYDANGKFIKHVKIISWPTSGGFYEKFAKDAMESHKLRGTRAPHVPFFSYLPRFAQMNAAQWAYYLYMKERAACGVGLPEADLSYVILYIYEIINLDGIIPPEQGAAMLASVWMLYRKVHPMLDKYMSEWMADYCLIHGLSVPKILYPDIASLAAPSTVKEFYAESVFSDVKSETGHLFRLTLSDYNIQKSRYASKYDDFEERCNRVFDETVAEQLECENGIFDSRLLRRITVKRTAFCGALCASKVKKTLELELVTPFHAPVMRRVVTDIMKGAENAVRAGLGIRSRLNAPPLTGRAANAAKELARESEYIDLYAALSDTLSPENAALLEKKSWRNAEILTDADLEEEFDDTSLTTSSSDASNPVPHASAAAPTCEVCADVELQNEREGAPAEMISVTLAEADSTLGESGEATLREVLGESLYSLLSAAADGKSFAAACRSANVFADDAARRINEGAFDIVGDVLLEADGTDYIFIEDYREFL